VGLWLSLGIAIGAGVGTTLLNQGKKESDEDSSSTL